MLNKTFLKLKLETLSVYFRWVLMDHIDVIHKGLLKYPCKFCGQKMKSHAAKKYHQERHCPLRHQGEPTKLQPERVEPENMF